MARACLFHESHADTASGSTHYQLKQPQGKLVRVVAGEVFDVAVDLRRSSPRYGRWAGQRLSADNKRMLWIPPGFAHGFLAMSEFAEVLYKTTDYYAPAHERCVLWNDPYIGVDWPLISEPLISEKDGRGVALKLAETFP
jgi:dTDP-4-dehydrorhamnose 3,5-epimerase